VVERYYTVMLVPDKQEYVRTIKIPTFALKAGAVILSVIILITGVFIYDYWSILQQVYENKHLSLENKQLREQLQLFQMKLNTMTKDLERIYTFEKS
jgi:cell shape-determining protein MreC